MTTEEFQELIEKQPSYPETLPTALQALWCDKKGDWRLAHEIVQSAKDADSAWVHAYLHRKEGDLSNARYWYQRSGHSEFLGKFNHEWTQITSFILRKWHGR